MYIEQCTCIQLVRCTIVYMYKQRTCISLIYTHSALEAVRMPVVLQCLHPQVIGCYHPLATMAGGPIRLVKAVLAEELVVLQVESLLCSEVDGAAAAQETRVMIVVVSCIDGWLKEEGEEEEAEEEEKKRINRWLKIIILNSHNVHVHI